MRGDWLGSPDGTTRMLADIRETLMVNMQIEKHEGQHIRDSRTGPASARMSRRQYKELAELVMAITDKLER